MKIYIKSSLKDKYKSKLDMLVDGNKLWDPLDGEFREVSEEQIEEWKNPKPELLSYLKPSTQYVFRNGRLNYVSQIGETPDDTKVYRNAGRYKIYLQSFKVALPYTKVIVADTETGDVFAAEVTQGIGDFKRDIAELQEWLMDGNTI